MQNEYYKYIPIIYWILLEVADDDSKEKKIPFMRFYKLYNLEQREDIYNWQSLIILIRYNGVKISSSICKITKN